MTFWIYFVFFVINYLISFIFDPDKSIFCLFVFLLSKFNCLVGYTGMFLFFWELIHGYQ